MPVLYDRSYVYDGVGNRTRMVESTGTGLVTTTYEHDASNQLTTMTVDDGGTPQITTYAYDACGNLTEKHTPEGTTYYTTNAAGQAEAIEPVSGPVQMAYNAWNQRVSKTTSAGTTKFIHDELKLLLETDANDDTTRSYTHGTGAAVGGAYGDLIEEYDPDSTESAYPAYDAQYSPTELIDESEASTRRYRHTAFGLPASGSTPSWCDLSAEQWSNASVEDWEQMPVCSSGMFGFGGQRGYYHDPETELYLLGGGTGSDGGTKGAGRFYDPELGRFITQDPLGLASGSINLYRYVNNNPVDHVDPSGNEAIGHHWMTVKSLTQLLDAGKITPDAFRLGMGYYSGQTTPRHRGRHAGEVDLITIELLCRKPPDVWRSFGCAMRSWRVHTGR